MIRCLAVDDEAYATKMIADYIGKVPYLELVGVANNAIDALAKVREGGVDLVFLDIRMPQLTGLDFLKLCGDKCKVILTTAYAEYALDGFEYSVIDYLLKPIAFDRFFKATEKALEVFQPRLNPVVASPQNQPGYLFIKGDSKNKFLKVDHQDILYIEGLKNYVSIYTKTQRLITYQALRELEEQLPQPPFHRVHKSYIVSIDKIRLIDGNTLYVGDTALPIGGIYREAFLKVIRGA
ncbi:LytR/AlgR family response regulator transcription factor [Mucilaginibacter psychrotolerans]|uniref:Response regulator transcription factor n=1 Tax=Mucilaginibacter psychrotolerans TaxID=1524096 RepID=A0A4Y8SFA8_9SPHI|nr:LytTR family DNA-binding domain-containing protein [Mucilaginibacter psychrotolerans]TFF37582.1 response regulator transcription factor [Mucilaginibacter psychrotolerans]